MFLGEDLLAYLVRHKGALVSREMLARDVWREVARATGAAVFVGSLAALIRPPEQRREGDLERPPLARSLVFAGIGLVGAIWALASLVS